jgi:hypothetical protein
MEAAIVTGVRADYSGLALRTRGRSSSRTACHAPGCHHRVPAGKRFCASCQATLDRVRSELAAAGPRGRKPMVRKSA